MKYIERYLNWGQGNFINGKIVVDKESCTGCKQCVNVCPASALEVLNKKSGMIPGAECISCAACQAVCTEDAIRIATLWKIPDGSFQTLNRKQSFGAESFPRVFKKEPSL